MKNILLLTLVISCFETFAQPITQEDRAKANAYFVAADWQNVVSAYQAIAKQEPQNANARMRAGIALLNQSKTQPAIKQLEEATVLGPNPMAFFYLATAYAQANQKKNVWLHLIKH
ncbi:MAG: hypothetical protein IPK96_15700 [Flammeovirgaceae bacterium]|nr:hypothetical protein [Flammeovirgaceae bacterium]